MDVDEDINFYRQVPAPEYFYGYSSNGKNDAILVVYQPDDKKLAREYFKEDGIWKCIECNKLGQEVCINNIKEKELFASLKHFCQPKSVEEIVKEQQEYKNLFLYGSGDTLEREADFYTSSAEFDKFDPEEYKFGVNDVKCPNSRLIAQQKGNPENVYHYHKHEKRWICQGCISITHNSDIFGEFVQKYLYLPKQHVCEPIKAQLSEKEQQNLLFNAPANLYVDKIFNEHKNSLRILHQFEYKYATVGGVVKKKVIVTDPSNQSLIYEFYFKSPSIWYCTRCAQQNKLDTYAIQKDGNMFVSTKHKCKPIKYFDAVSVSNSWASVSAPCTTNEETEPIAAPAEEEKGWEEEGEMSLLDADLLGSFANMQPSTSAAVKSSARPRKRKSSESGTVSTTRTYNLLHSEILAKIPRVLNKSAGKDTVIRVFTPKKCPFPVKIPPSYVVVPKKPILKKSPVRPKIIKSPKVISMSPIFLDDNSNDAAKINYESASLNSSPDYDALMAAEKAFNYDEEEVVLNKRSSKGSHSGASNADSTQLSSNGKNKVQFDNEKLNSSKSAAAAAADDDDDDEIQIIEPHIPLIPNMQNQSVSSALLQFIDSKIEDDRNEIASNITVSPASSPNILPFENDKVGDNEENNDDEMDNNIYEIEQVASPSESSNSVHRLDYTYPFQPPSDAFIRSTLEKLKIPFIRKALHFWAEVLFTEIPKRSSPESTFAITSWNDSFFKCLSCFFTGKENHFFYIKAQIQAYICNNLRTFESDDGIDFSKLDVTGQKFKQFYQCNKLTTTHYEFICAWLQCRIGVYTTNGILERYGNWSDNSEEYIPILLMQNYTGLYKPVLTLL